MNQTVLKSWTNGIVFFVIISFFLFLFGNQLQEKGIDKNVLLAANLVIFGMCFVSFLLTRKSVGSTNPNAFVRGIYMGFIFKFFILAAAALAYAALAKNISKNIIFISMALYIVYTWLEVSALMRLLKQKKDA